MTGFNVLDTHPRGFVNPVTFRAPLILTPAFDTAPTVVRMAFARGMTLSLTYTRGAAGGAADLQFQSSIYGVAADVVAGSGEWSVATLLASGVLVPGAQVASDLQGEYITYKEEGTGAAETRTYVIEFASPIERLRIHARESVTGVPGTPGTLALVAEVW
jgi:hypothetical protein